MSLQFMKREVQQAFSSDPSDSSQLPKTIVDSINQIKRFALQEFDREVAQKQLYYHSQAHIDNVQRRAALIFQAIYPDWNASEINQAQDLPPFDLARTKLLLELCVVAHDMVQVFAAQTQDHAARQRRSGESEMATIDRLVHYIQNLNEQLQQVNPNSSARLTEDEIHTIREAIAATICVYNPEEQAIYQPKLADPELPIVARILALADVGALAIDGIEVYNQEGSLLFLEENLDVIPSFMEGTIHQLETKDPALYQNIRERLLKRCRFQVNFAKSRLARSIEELIGFPEEAIPRLSHEVFRYLTPETVGKIESMTPTDEQASLERLLQFFQFERYLN